MSTILLVEDQVLEYAPLQGVLESRGFEVLWATSASEGYRFLKIHQKEIKVIILDLLLPAADVGEKSEFSEKNIFRGGILLLNKIINELGLSIPIIGLTVVTDKDIRREVNGYCVEVIEKPFKIVELLNVLYRITQDSQVISQNYEDENENGGSK